MKRKEKTRMKNVINNFKMLLIMRYYLLVGEKIKILRAGSYQTKKRNIELSDPEKQYRINTFILIINHTV